MQDSSIGGKVGDTAFSALSELVLEICWVMDFTSLNNGQRDKRSFCLEIIYAFDKEIGVVDDHMCGIRNLMWFLSSWRKSLSML